MRPRLGLISLRYWMNRKGRALASIAGVALGVALIVAVSIVNDSILASYTGVVDELAGKAQLQVLSSTDEGFSQSLLKTVQSTDGVDKAVPVVVRSSILHYGDHKTPVSVWGVQPEADSAVRVLRIAKGRMVEANEHGGVVLSQAVAESLNLQVGQAVKLLTPQGLKDYKVVGLFTGVGSSGAGAGQIAFASLADAQETFMGNNDSVNQIDVVVGPDRNVDKVMESLAGGVRGFATVQKPADRGADVQQMLQGLQFMLGFASLISLLAAAYLIANNAAAATEERSRELAIIRALGTSARQVVGWIIRESLSLGLIGSLVGVVFGIGMASGLLYAVSATVQSMYRINLGSVTIPPSSVVAGVLVGLVVTAGSVAASARKASQVPPAAALRERFEQTGGDREGAGRARLAGLLVAAGAVGTALPYVAQDAMGKLPQGVVSNLGTLFAMLLVVGLASYLPRVCTFVGKALQSIGSAPLWFRLAADSMSRHGKRIGAAAASLMVTLAIAVGVFGMVDSYKRSIQEWAQGRVKWDLQVSGSLEGFSADVPLTEAVGRELASLEGVSKVSPLRFTFVRYGSSTASLYVFNMSDIPTIGELQSVEGVASNELPGVLKGAPKVAVSSTFGRLHGLKSGDRLILSTANGERSYDIAATVHDFGSTSGTIFMDRSTYLAGWSQTNVDSFVLVLKKGADQKAVISTIRGHFDKSYPLQIVGSAEYRKQMNGLVDQAFGLSQALVIVAVLVSLFALANAGMIGVWQLRRELAVLRALGSNTRLLTLTLLTESCLTGLVGGITGLAVGVLLSSVLVNGIGVASGQVIAWKLPVSALPWTGLTALVGSLLAGWIPARAAAATSLTAALRYE